MATLKVLRQKGLCTFQYCATLTHFTDTCRKTTFCDKWIDFYKIKGISIWIENTDSLTVKLSHGRSQGTVSMLYPCCATELLAQRSWCKVILVTVKCNSRMLSPGTASEHCFLPAHPSPVLCSCFDFCLWETCFHPLSLFFLTLWIYVTQALSPSSSPISKCLFWLSAPTVSFNFFSYQKQRCHRLFGGYILINFLYAKNILSGKSV